MTLFTTYGWTTMLTFLSGYTSRAFRQQCCHYERDNKTQICSFSIVLIMTALLSKRVGKSIWCLCGWKWISCYFGIKRARKFLFLHQLTKLHISNHAILRQLQRGALCLGYRGPYSLRMLLLTAAVVAASVAKQFYSTTCLILFM